jgi:hypothetical protein
LQTRCRPNRTPNARCDSRWKRWQSSKPRRAYGIADPGTENPFAGGRIPPEWRNHAFGGPRPRTLFGTPYTKGETRAEGVAREKADVARLMPTLAELRAGVLAIHRCFEYANSKPDDSDVWAWAWRAGDVNHIPYNHFGCLNFVSSNDTFVNRCWELAHELLPLVRSGALKGADADFVQHWLTAHDVVRKVDALNRDAVYWKSMREEYGEWAAPREQ